MIRAVFFDAVGTLIEPAPSAVDVYLAAARRHGTRLSRQTIAKRFRAAFCLEEAIDRNRGWRTDEEREQQRWRSIVGTVLDDVRDPEACFAELWQHFARPESWRCLPGAVEVLGELARQGFCLGVASNFDRRLRGVAAGMPALRPVRQLVISSEVGWRKPALQFFEQVVSAAGVSASEIVFVGDDPVNDDEGARRAGLRVLLLSPAGRITGLADVLETLLRLNSTEDSRR
jgi:putative hydrolase of the HAD superfamily